MSERDIFLALLDLPDPAARAAYLDTACGGDAALRGRVEALLRSHEDAGSFLGTPAVATPDAAHAPTLPFTAEGATPAGADEESLGFLAPPRRPDSLGRIGHYEVLEVLGRGGFGIVFRAFDEVLQRVVAVKVLAPELATTSPARKRFLREARSSAKVRHENVVQVHAVEEQPLPFLVMEFIPGETLQQRLDRTGPLEVSEILKFGREVAAGLAAAHATGLIHRDIKPGNVLIDGGPQPHAKITDFGLARAADDASLTRSGTVAGTPMYMAPEQARGEALDHRADLFSLGSVLYVMCTGRPPFRASGTLAVLKRVAEDNPRPIREVIPEVPEWLCRIVAKLHAKDPADRFQTAQEVADLLADCGEQLKTHGALRDYSRIPGGRPRRLHWVVQWAATAALLAILGVALVWWRGWVIELFASRPPVVDPASRVLEDLSRFQGRWRLVAAERYGKPLPVAELRSVDWIEFDGERQTTVWNGKTWTGTFKLNTAVAPREIDLLSPAYPAVCCLYRFDGDRLVMAQSLPGQPRPTAFTTTPDTAFSVATYVRDTSVPPPVPPGPQEPGPPPAPAGWMQLFNGRDLTGWNKHPNDPGNWRVEDGAITGSGGESYLFTDKSDYENFHLRAEARVNAAGDGGVLFRTGFQVIKNTDDRLGVRLPGQTSGYEATVNLRAHWPSHTGSLVLAADTLQKGPLNPHEPDEWFTLEITARGNHLRTVVNGQPTADYRDESNRFRRGHITLQNFAWKQPVTRIQFRRIEVKELPPEPTAATRPFVLLARDGRGESPHPTLADAVNAARPGDTVEIRGDGPYAVDFRGVSIDKPLPIRAGAGCRPLVTVKDPPVKDARGGVALEVFAPLVLEGLAFTRETAAPDEDTALILVQGGSLHATHCRFVTNGGQAVIRNRARTPAPINLRHCLLEGAAGAAVVIENGTRTQEMTFVNNLFADLGKAAVQFESRTALDSTTARIKAERNTFKGHLLADATPGRTSVLCTATENVFARPIFPVSRARPGSTGSLPKHFFWKGQCNLYPDAEALAGLARPEGDAVIGSPTLVDGPSASGPSWRLRQGSPGQGAGRDGRDLGADVDRVGPGEPYEAWAKSPEYAAWRQEVAALLTGTHAPPPTLVPAAAEKGGEDR